MDRPHTVLPAPDSLVAALASGPPPAPAGKACLPQTEGPDFFSFVFVRVRFFVCFSAVNCGAQILGPLAIAWTAPISTVPAIWASTATVLSRACSYADVIPPDEDVTQLPDGTFFNHKLQALNVFEVDVDEALIDEAADIFYSGGADAFNGPFGGIGEREHSYDDCFTPCGRFFTQRVRGWSSNIAWCAVDDEQSFAKLRISSNGCSCRSASHL
jgi:hypothetical protein